MENEISRSSRRNNNLGIIMLDLDHFKRFNDTYGHETGDFILSEFGKLLRLFKRKEDIACRYGGEEFTILLPETDRKTTIQVAERIRLTVKERDFILHNRSYGVITLSAGAATFPDDGRNPDTLLKKADEALYAAKEAGRDRVIHISDIHDHQ